MALRFLSTRLSSTAPLCSSTAPFLRPALPLFARVSPTNNPPTTPRTRTFATTTSKMSSTSALVDLAKNRRTIYKLGKTSPVSDSQIEELVNAAITHVPSSFNTQSTRLLVLLHQEHEKLWDIVIDMFGELVKTGAVPEELWKNQTLPKLKGMQAGVGTILFYEDPAHIKPFAEKFAIYKDHFQPWAEHSNAMHQYFLWTGLEALGFGANLQHYNPLIDTPVSKQWNIPSEWRLISQLVFGSPEASANEKTQKPIEERVKIYGKQ